MKKISIIILVLVATLASCKKTPEVNLKYVDVERDLVTVGTTTANIQCDYQYITTMKKAYFCYGEGENEDAFTSAEMRVVQNTLYVELIGLKANTTYSYYYEFHNGFNSMRTALKTFKTEASPTTVTLPTVVTATVTEITANSAKGGGEVTNDGGAEVTERGICWSTNANPILNADHVAAGAGIGTFTAMMNGLEANTIYHVRAYATNEVGTAYGLDREFMTSDVGCDCDYVDLGLPSGTLWATCNLGANSPEESGDFFAWGEIEPKNLYSWETYKYCHGSDITMTKYCPLPQFGYNGFTDTLTILEPSDDAVVAALGDDYCMPTYDAWVELYQNTNHYWIQQNGVNGRLFVSENGQSLFIPAVGYYDVGGHYGAPIFGFYWSSKLYSENPNGARFFSFTSDSYEMNWRSRFDGLPIRPIRKNGSPAPPPPPGGAPEGAINGLFTINENGDQVYFSQGNLQYRASTNTWRFAEKQWDFVGDGTYGTVYENGVKCNNELISSTYDGWIDLFGWGTSGWDNGNLYYHPYDSHYDSDFNQGYGPVDGSDLTGAYTNADWGIYNPISNGGNVDNQWRTLTYYEWWTVFNGRITDSGLRYAKAIVNDVFGVILLPDNWRESYYHINNPNVDDSFCYNNIISQDDWRELLEAKGAVFFPSAGLRGGESGELFIYFVNSNGYYWSSTNRQGPGSCALYFSDTWLLPENYGNYSCNGFSVRLIHDANPQNKSK